MRDFEFFGGEDANGCSFDVGDVYDCAKALTQRRSFEQVTARFYEFIGEIRPGVGFEGKFNEALYEREKS